MSKSLGNVVAPEEVVKELGADILRLWAASADYRADVRISKDILRQLTEVYRRIRNTCRFLLADVGDFDPVRDQVPLASMRELDRWAVERMRRLAEEVVSAYRRYEFHHLFRDIHNFCATEMGGFYLDAVKDRLYCDAADSAGRRSAQTALWEILTTLVRLIAPVLVFTADEIWQHLPPAGRTSESVHLEKWQLFPPAEDDAFRARWQRILEVRSRVTKALEEARARDIIGSSLEAAVSVYGRAEELAPLIELQQREPGALEEIFIVSAVTLHVDPEKELHVVAEPAPGEKCVRCWKYSTRLGTSPAHPQLCPRCTEVVEATL